jgi:hypothetical protein
MASEQQQRFPLRFGIETGIPTDRGPFNAKEYRIEVDRDYEVVSFDEPARTRTVRGSCHVQGLRVDLP